MRNLFAILLFITSCLYAETQQEAYLRALKAEKSGNNDDALNAFEEAAALPGPYTEEIQEILKNYQEAMSPWALHFSGNIEYTEIFAKEIFSSFSRHETAGNLDGTLGISLEYNSPSWTHSFDLSLGGALYFGNEDSAILDTNSWDYSVGLGYSLVGSTFFLNLGVDWNDDEEKSRNLDFYTWTEKYFWKSKNYRVGGALWAYGDSDGLMSYALYGSWKKVNSHGLKSSVYLGGRFEADSSFQNSMWIGPSLKPSLSYKTQVGVGLEVRLNLFYGFALDGPDSDFSKIHKLNISLSDQIFWEIGYVSLYAGLERNFRYYWLPKSYRDVYSENRRLTKISAGIRWDL